MEITYTSLNTIKSGSKWIVMHDWFTPYAIVNAGFVSDGVTVPYLFRWFIHQHGALFKAAVLHDFLYKNEVESKQYADKAFYNTAIYYKVNIIKAKIAYFAVKLFGKGNY